MELTELKELQQNFSELNEAYKKLASARNKEQAEKNADDALARVITSLNQDNVVAKLDEFIVSSREKLLSAPEEIKIKMTKHRRDIISVEVQASNLKNTEVGKLIDGFCRFKGDFEKIDYDTSKYRRYLEDMHNKLKVVVLGNLKAPRQKKKKERRKIFQYISGLCAGLFMIIANIEESVYTSYFLGCVPIITVIENFVRE
jgi:sugar-specific transcriptional regulator TrmB